MLWRVLRLLLVFREAPGLKTFYWVSLMSMDVTAPEHRVLTPTRQRGMAGKTLRDLPRGSRRFEIRFERENSQCKRKLQSICKPADV